MNVMYTLTVLHKAWIYKIFNNMMSNTADGIANNQVEWVTLHLALTNKLQTNFEEADVIQDS